MSRREEQHEALVGAIRYLRDDVIVIRADCPPDTGTWATLNRVTAELDLCLNHLKPSPVASYMSSADATENAGEAQPGGSPLTQPPAHTTNPARDASPAARGDG